MRGLLLIAAAEGGDDAGFVMHLITWLGNFHPASSAFPVALLLSAFLAEGLGLVTGRAGFRPAARFCLAVGTAGAVVSAALGWCFGGWDLAEDDTTLSIHRWLGTGVAAWAVVVLGLSLAAHRRPGRGWRAAYLAALGLAAVGVVATGYFGGGMVYGMDHYAW